MTDTRFTQLPRALADRALFTFLGPRRDIPALLAHPDAGWIEGVPSAGEGVRPASARPVVLWFHGRSVNKELDPGRYLRWLRAGSAGRPAGLAVCAVDLPGHGERFDAALQSPGRTLEVVERAADEVDFILDDLAHPRFGGVFDLSRCAIGGMSAGGMVTMVRLCREHPFRAAAVEATTGDFSALIERGLYDPVKARSIEPLSRLGGWRPIPMLALHSEADQWVPVSAMRSFLDALARRYRDAGADPGLIEFRTWPSTGAPNEHYGFGSVSNEAKNIQTDFLFRWLSDSAA